MLLGSKAGLRRGFFFCALGLIKLLLSLLVAALFVPPWASLRAFVVTVLVTAAAPVACNVSTCWLTAARALSASVSSARAESKLPCVSFAAACGRVQYQF